MVLPFVRPNEAGGRLGARSLRKGPARSVRLLGAAETAKTISRALFSAGMLERDAVDEGLQPGLRRKHASCVSCSVGAFGNSDAT